VNIPVKSLILVQNDQHTAFIMPWFPYYSPSMMLLISGMKLCFLGS